jgi:hypothetical protein
MIQKEESKTLEEVAEKLFPVFQRSTPFGSKYPWTPHKERESFKRGAKWQAERMYSEEEVLKIVTSCKEYLSFGDEFDEKEWFEQHKKK